MRKRLWRALTCVLAVFALAAVQVEEQETGELASYPVRWVHGVQTDFGTLSITTTSMIFSDDEGRETNLPYLHLDVVRVVDRRWIQVRSNLETGASWGLNDVYNFGVIGPMPGDELIERVNELILAAKRQRVEEAELLPGERSRYLVAKMERIGDDVGMLVITEDALHYRSDTGGRDHTWEYSSLTGVELLRTGLLKVHTTERSIWKLGAHRAYRFVSQTGPYAIEDLAFLIQRIAEANEEAERR